MPRMLTKSDFIGFLQCQRQLWLHKNRKDLEAQALSTERAALIEGGFAVERHAYQLFPDGVDADDADIKAAIAKTKRLIKSGERVIYQPTFANYQTQTFCRADILVRNGRGAYDVFEVKSSTEVKPVHHADLAFQRLCLEAAGVKVKRLSVVYVNKAYVRRGAIDPQQLLLVEDVTAKVEAMLGEVQQELTAALRTMTLKDEPVVRVLRQCNSPYPCPFLDYCQRNVPVDSIYDVTLPEKEMIRLLEAGVVLLKDVPPALFTRALQKAYHTALLTNRVHVDQAAIRAWLGQLAYPLHFLDYETVSGPIPAFDGCRPYQQVPFQFSLHVQARAGGQLKHHEFLATEGGDPRPAFAQALAAKLGPKGSVITWNMPFEAGRNRELGEFLPERAAFLAQVNARLVDLGKPFAAGHYVHREFRGSWSIKAVLPVLVPDLSYGRLAIGHGVEAANSWPLLVGGTLAPSEQAKLAGDLRAYCALDTMGMVRILEVLRQAVAKR